MFTLSLTSVGLFSSSTVSAVAVPLDSNKPTFGLAQYAAVQEIASDNAAVEKSFVSAENFCNDNVECGSAGTVAPAPSINSRFAEQNGYSALQPVLALVLVVMVLVVFLSRKSTSAK